MSSFRFTLLSSERRKDVKISILWKCRLSRTHICPTFILYWICPTHILNIVHIYLSHTHIHLQSCSIQPKENSFKAKRNFLCPHHHPRGLIFSWKSSRTTRFINFILENSNQITVELQSTRVNKYILTNTLAVTTWFVTG